MHVGRHLVSPQANGMVYLAGMVGNKVDVSGRVVRGGLLLTADLPPREPPQAPKELVSELVIEQAKQALAHITNTLEVRGPLRVWCSRRRRDCIHFAAVSA